MTRDELIVEMSQSLRAADSFRLRLTCLDHCCKARQRCNNCPATESDYNEAPKRCETGEPTPMEEWFDYNPTPRSET